MSQTISSQLIHTYEDQLRQANQKALKISWIVTLIFLGLSLPFAVLFERAVPFKVFFFLFFGWFLLAVLFTLLMKKFFVSEKPLYLTLYPSIIEAINYNELVTLSYESYPQNKTVIKTSRLFTHFASSILRGKLAFETKKGHFVEVYDAYVFTSSGESTTVYLNGLYGVIRNASIPTFQLRASGSPSGKEPRYLELQSTSGLKEFVLDQGAQEIEAKYKKIYASLTNNVAVDKVFLSGIDSELHMGIAIRKITRKVKVLNQETYDRIYQNLMSVVSAMETIDTILSLDETNS